MAPQPSLAALNALLLQPVVQRFPAGKARDRHEEVPPRITHQPLNLTLVVVFARSPETILEQVVRLQLAENFCSLALSVPQDPRHCQLRVVVDDAPRHATKVTERFVVAFAARLARLCWKRLHENIITLGQVDHQVVRFRLHPGDFHPSLTEIGLGVAGWMLQRHEHLLLAELLLADVILDDRVTAREVVLVA